MQQGKGRAAEERFRCAGGSIGFLRVDRADHRIVVGDKLVECAGDGCRVVDDLDLNRLRVPLVTGEVARS